MTDSINPDHYKYSESGVECIQVTEQMSFTLGNAVKYLWRVGHKDDLLTDLYKARWYLDREMTFRIEHKGLFTPPFGGNYDEWCANFEKHIKTVKNIHVQQCLTYCMQSVLPHHTKRTLEFALDHIERAIAAVEKSGTLE